MVKATQNPEEIKELLEIGFEYVCQKDNLIFLGRENEQDKHKTMRSNWSKSAQNGRGEVAW